MELIAFDTSRIIFLLQVHRRAGQPYVPEVAAKLVQRYSFAKYPTLDDLQKETFFFGMGKFRNVQISELGIYNDGVIVAGRCDTQLLEEFLDDLFDWIANEFEFVPIPQIRTEKHFESTIIVRSKIDLAAIVSPNKAATDLIASRLEQNTNSKYHPTGTLFDCDLDGLRTRRKPVRLSIERRLGLPFAEGMFFCQAPLKTDDHLALLRALEALPLG